MKWITDRQPRNGAEKLVTVVDMYGARNVTVASYHKGRWLLPLSCTVIAWAPLPRAYRGHK